MTTSYNPEYEQRPSSQTPQRRNNTIEEEKINKKSYNIHMTHMNDDNDSGIAKSQSSSCISTLTGSSTTHSSSLAATHSTSAIQSISSSQSLSTSPNHYFNRNTKYQSSITVTSSPSKLISNHENLTKQIGYKSRLPSTPSKVERIISITPVCYLKPKSFFVAWNSVITLVFNGWPEPIDTMKNELSNKCTICKEMFGSKFPKITLACVRDGIEMTPKLLSQLRRLCKKYIPPKDYVLTLDCLSVVLYENRCQESVIYEKIIPLKKNHKFLGSPRPLLLDMEEEQDDAPYLRSANRTSHYRSLVVGSSIVYRLIRVPKFITDFQSKLPKEIFDTFSKESLHVTVRALS